MAERAKEAQQRRRIFQGRYELFDARHDDVDARQGLSQVAVALVGDDDARPGLGDPEVGASYADIGAEKPRDLDGPETIPRPAGLPDDLQALPGASLRFLSIKAIDGFKIEAASLATG